MLTTEHEQIAEAIGRAKIKDYTPKMAIAHEVAVVLFGGPTTGPDQNPDYRAFRDIVLLHHRAIRRS